MALSPKLQKSFSLIFRRAQEHKFGRWLISPFQTQFEVKSIEKLSFDHKRKQVKQYKYLAAQQLKLSLPAEFTDYFPEDLLPFEGEYSTSPVSLIEIREGSIFTDSIFNIVYLDSENIGVRECSYTFGVNESKLIQVDVPKVHKIKSLRGTVFSLLSGGGATYNYFHWLVDALARLYVLKESHIEDREIDFYLVPSLSKPFQKETLKAIGIPLEKVITCYDYPYLKANRVLATTHPRKGSKIPEWIIPFLREKFLNLNISHSDTAGTYSRDMPSHVYISRGDVGRRGIINEQEVVELLSNYGFKPVQLAKLSFMQQVRLFKKAKSVIGTHGAGLANFIFSTPNIPVLEFFPEDYMSHLYYDVAQQVGLTYHYIVCESDWRTKPIDSNLRVDLDELERSLNKMGIKKI